jgi:hypothetical protein
LRLDGDDPRAQAAERGDAVADMAANVEDEVAGADEARIVPVERAAPPPVAVIDAQRPDDAARPLTLSNITCPLLAATKNSSKY